MAIIFFLVPALQIIQLFKKTLKATDVSYLVFIMNGSMSIFFFSDFYRIQNMVGTVPHAISIPLNLTYFVIYSVFRYSFPYCALSIFGSVIYVLTFLSLGLFLLPLVAVATIALVLNVFVGLATLQKLVSFSINPYLVLRIANL